MSEKSDSNFKQLARTIFKELLKANYVVFSIFINYSRYFLINFISLKACYYR